ncbi:hypothetical protein DFH09DRAFT_899686 [Mycena vulgaris]|nr:hypothetical protein DFH09DRAFT_899686 [Mycena vulgaris]
MVALSFQHSPELWIVMAILRLSHKYDVHYLYLRALDHLPKDGWYSEAYDDKSTDHLIVPNAAGSDMRLTISVLATATEVGALWLLSWAYYFTSAFSAKKLIPLLQGSIEQHVRKCLDAHVHFVRGSASVNRFLTIRSRCAMDEACSALRDSYLSNFLDDIEGGKDLDPLFCWDVTSWWNLKAQEMCDDCLELAKTQHHAAAQAFWNKLPSIFGLPPWEDLRTMQHAAMGEDSLGDMLG